MFAVVLVAACNGQVSDRGSPALSPAAAACDAYFDAYNNYVTRCEGLPVRDDPVARARARASCLDYLGLPGQGRNMNVCAAAWKSAPCRGSHAALIAACAQPGTEGNGAACYDGLQCASGHCEWDPKRGVDCGSCASSVPLGQACTSLPNTCALGGGCINSTCVAFGSLEIGGDCETSDNFCKTGLACDFSTKICVSLGGIGVPCTFTNTCQEGLACVNKVCAPPVSKGEPCQDNFNDCAPGLVCVPMLLRCAPVTYDVNPGQPCGLLMDSFAECRTAPLPPYACCQIIDAIFATGTCPNIIPDGQRCVLNSSTKVCDGSAMCRSDGACALGPSSCQ